MFKVIVITFLFGITWILENIYNELKKKNQNPKT